jgi:hypothetical protein
MSYRNQRTTYWPSYWEELWTKLRVFPGHFGTVEDTELAAEFLQQDIVSSYKNRHLLRTIRGKKFSSGAAKTTGVPTDLGTPLADSMDVLNYL